MMANESTMDKMHRMNGLEGDGRFAGSRPGRVSSVAALRRKPLAVLVCMITIIALVSFAGCTGERSSADPGDARTVTDAYGRSVDVPANVESVATVGSAARFVVYAGGSAGVEKLVAVTGMEVSPAPNRPYSMAYADAFAGLPSTSNGNHLMETSVDAEALLGLHPDVIISSRSAEECDRLQSDLGIPVVGISYQDQLFTDDVRRSIQAVGDAIGTSEHAGEIVAALQKWGDDLAARGEKARAALARSGSAEPSVYVGAVNYKGAKSFGGTFQRYAPVDAIGAMNVADELGGAGSVEVSLEQLGEWNPDAMFLNADNLQLLKDDYAANGAFLGQLRAFQTGSLYSQPSFNYNGTNVELGVCDAYFIGAVVYPDAFSDIDLPAKYEEVLSTLLGCPYYGKMKVDGMDFVQLDL